MTCVTVTLWEKKEETEREGERPYSMVLIFMNTIVGILIFPQLEDMGQPTFEKMKAESLWWKADIELGLDGSPCASVCLCAYIYTWSMCPQKVIMYKEMGEVRNMGIIYRADNKTTSLLWMRLKKKFKGPLDWKLYTRLMLLGFNVLKLS